MKRAKSDWRDDIAQQTDQHVLIAGMYWQWGPVDWRQVWPGILVGEAEIRMFTKVQYSFCAR